MRIDQISDHKDDICLYGKLCSNLLPQTANKSTKFTGNNSFLKVELSSFKKALFIRFNASPSKVMKNAFYFTIKAFFALKIFKFFLGFLGMQKKRLD